MILVGQFDSPFVRRVAVTLHHYGLPFRRNTMSVISDAAEMARINPLGRVPSLILDDGEVLIDSNAIVDYLEEQAGDGANLLPRSGPARRQALRLVGVASGVVDKAIAIAYERHFHPEASVSGAWISRCETQIANSLSHLEALARESWFVGGRLSQADIMTGTMLGYLALRLPELFPRHDFPRLASLGERCEALPSFSACRPAPNEVLPSR
jgi:glutathione S-transferase